MNDVHPHPFGEAATKFVEVTAMAAMAAQHYAEHRARNARAAADAITENETRRGKDQARYAPLLDRVWRADASLPDVFRAWAAAEPYAGEDPHAAEALKEAEDLLRQRSPYAMKRYEQLRAEGMSRPEAMNEAAKDFAYSAPPPAGKSEPVPAPGLSEDDALAFRQALAEVSRLNAEWITAERGPVPPAAAEAAVRQIKGVTPDMAAKIAIGVRDGKIRLPSGQRTIADHGVAGQNWPSGAGKHAGSGPRPRSEGRPARRPFHVRSRGPVRSA